ncbi:1-phosphatidylinositol-3-phosphate 5-kinase, partial [Nowakowskiella sp. JEL0407]
MEKEKRLSFASSHPDPLQYSAKTISSSKPIHSTLQKNSKELSPIALNHLKLLLHQQLRLTDLPPDRISIWLNVLSKILISVGLNVEPDIKNGDEMGLLQYVKIKNVCGGRPEDSHYVAGVVCTKIVPHKSMLRVVENPRILLVMFPIEFTGEEEFESLDMLLISEREFIRNLVYRILDFKPNVILCSKSVSRLALNLFIQSNVVVIPNVKPTVIEAVARCTQADIFSDVTFNNQPKLGLCQKFYTKTYSHSIPPHFKSTYLYFSGCPKQLGCTVVLRGENIQTLAKLKQITDLMAFVVYNLKLETFLYRDICAPEFQVLEEKMIKDWGIGSGAEITKDDVNVFNALLKFKKTILTASPGIKFPPPYQLLQYAEKHELVKKYNLPADFFEGSYNLTTPPNLNFPTNGQVNGNQYHNRSLEPQNEILIDAKYLDILSVDGLSPYQQQYLMLLYSNLCTHNTTPCRPPEPLIIEYYRDTDMTLGQYLEELASKSTTNCPSKDCDRPMLSHFWVYAHNNGRINVIIEDYPCPIPNATSKILVWSFCKQCRTTTEIIQMSNETWHYSFGKYLELSFYLDANVVIPKKEDDVIPESPTTTPTTPKVNGQHNFSKYCTHNVFRDHIRYFGTQNLVVRFEFEPIDLFDISHPSIQLYNHAPTNLKLRNADLAVLQSQIEAYYGSLRNRLDTINYSSIAEYKHLEVEDYLQDLDFRVESEMEEFRELKKSVEMENVNDTLVTKRVLVWFKEKISEWDLEFATFQKKVWGDGKGGKWGKDVLRAFTESGDGKKKEKKKEREAAKKKEEKAEMEWGWEEEKEFEEPKLGSSPTIQLASLPVPEDEEDFLENKIGINIMSNSSPVLDTPTYPMIQSIPLSDSFSGAMTLPSTVSISTSQFSNNNRMSVNLVGQGSVGLESELSATSAPTVAKLWELIEYDCVAEPEVFVDIIDLGLGYEEYELSQGETFFEPVEEENNVVEEEEENLGNATAVTNANGAISSQGSVAEVKKDKNEDEGNKAGGLMKTIAGLWTGGAGGLAPLEYPPAMNEHIFPDSQIVVRENEPSSIIAFTLA